MSRDGRVGEVKGVSAYVSVHNRSVEAQAGLDGLGDCQQWRKQDGGWALSDRLTLVGGKRGVDAVANEDDTRAGAAGPDVEPLGRGLAHVEGLQQASTHDALHGPGPISACEYTILCGGGNYRHWRRAVDIRSSCHEDGTCPKEEEQLKPR